MVGPVLGSIIYSVLDFEYTFYAFGGIFIFAVILVALLLPKRLNVV